MRREREREKERERIGSLLRVSRCALWHNEGEIPSMGTWYLLRPVPIPSSAITYNNDGLMEPVGDLTSARKREEETPRGRYEGV